MKIIYTFFFLILSISSSFGNKLKFDIPLKLVDLTELFDIENIGKSIILSSSDINKRINKLNKIVTFSDLESFEIDYDKMRVNFINRHINLIKLSDPDYQMDENLKYLEIPTYELRKKNVDIKTLDMNTVYLKLLKELHINEFTSKKKMNRAFDYLFQKQKSYSYFGDVATSFSILLQLKNSSKKKIFIRVPYPELLESMNLAVNAELNYSSIIFDRIYLDEEIIYEIRIPDKANSYELFINYSGVVKKEKFKDKSVGFYALNEDTVSTKINFIDKFKIVSSTLSVALEKMFIGLKNKLITRYQIYKINTEIFIIKIYNQIKFNFLFTEKFLARGMNDDFSKSENIYSDHIANLLFEKEKYYLDYTYHLTNLDKDYIISNNSFTTDNYLYDITDIPISSKLNIKNLTLNFINNTRQDFFYFLFENNIYYFTDNIEILFDSLIKNCFAFDKFLSNQLINLNKNQKYQLLMNKYIDINYELFFSKNKIRGSCSNISLNIVS